MPFVLLDIVQLFFSRTINQVEMRKNEIICEYIKSFAYYSTTANKLYCLQLQSLLDSVPQYSNNDKLITLLLSKNTTQHLLLFFLLLVLLFDLPIVIIDDSLRTPRKLVPWRDWSHRSVITSLCTRRNTMKSLGLSYRTLSKPFGIFWPQRVPKSNMTW